MPFWSRYKVRSLLCGDSAAHTARAPASPRPVLSRSRHSTSCSPFHEANALPPDAPSALRQRSSSSTPDNRGRSALSEDDVMPQKSSHTFFACTAPPRGTLTEPLEAKRSDNRERQGRRRLFWIDFFERNEPRSNCTDWRPFHPRRNRKIRSNVRSSRSMTPGKRNESSLAKRFRFFSRNPNISANCSRVKCLPLNCRRDKDLSAARILPKTSAAASHGNTVSALMFAFGVFPLVMCWQGAGPALAESRPGPWCA